MQQKSTKQEYLDQIIAALEKVPTKKLLLIELANSIPIKQGSLDVDALREKQLEVNLAIAEAKAYGSHTLQAVDALFRLSGQPVNDDLRPAAREEPEDE
jgi:hypothetical protein